MCSGTDRADRHRSRHAMDGMAQEAKLRGDDAPDETPELSVSVAACAYLARHVSYAFSPPSELQADEEARQRPPHECYLVVVRYGRHATAPP